MQRSFAVVTLALTMLAGPHAAAAWPCGDDAALGARHEGEAVINGMSMPVTAWITSSVKDPMPALVAACTGRAAVAVSRTGLNDVALIAPLRSRQCPLCPLPPPTLAALAQQVYAVTSSPFPGGEGNVLIGSPMGTLHGVKPAPAYQGQEWPRLGPSLSAVVQANFRFARAQVGSLTASSSLAPRVAMAAADADLLAHGYALMQEAAESDALDQRDFSRTYRRDQSVLNVRVGRDGSDTHITITESQAG